MNSTRGAGPGSRGADIPGNLPRRTGAGPRFQVNKEVFFLEVGFVGASRHSGNQGTSRVGEGLPGIAVPVGGVAQQLLHRHTGVGFTPFHQFQGPQVVRSVAGQHLHGRDQLEVSVHHNRRFVPIKALDCCSCGRGASGGHAPTPSGPCLLRPSGQYRRRCAPRPPFGAGGRLWSSNCPSNSSAATICWHSGLPSGRAPCDERQLVLPVASISFAGRDEVNHPVRRYRIDHRSTSRTIEAENYGRKDPGDSGGQGRHLRAFGTELAEWPVALRNQARAPVAHPV